MIAEQQWSQWWWLLLAEQQWRQWWLDVAAPIEVCWVPQEACGWMWLLLPPMKHVIICGCVCPVEACWLRKKHVCVCLLLAQLKSAGLQ